MSHNFTLRTNILFPDNYSIKFYLYSLKFVAKTPAKKKARQKIVKRNIFTLK